MNNDYGPWGSDRTYCSYHEPTSQPEHGDWHTPAAASNDDGAFYGAAPYGAASHGEPDHQTWQLPDTWLAPALPAGDAFSAQGAPALAPAPYAHGCVFNAATSPEQGALMPFGQAPTFYDAPPPMPQDGFGWDVAIAQQPPAPQQAYGWNTAYASAPPSQALAPPSHTIGAHAFGIGAPSQGMLTPLPLAVATYESEIATRIHSLLPQSRLQQALRVGQAAHATPMMVSIPAGLVSISIGGRLTLNKRTATFEMRCRDLNNPNEPCYLLYQGTTDKGAMGGFGAGSSGVGGRLYGGYTRGSDVAFQRRIDDVHERRAIYAACRNTTDALGDAALKPYMALPDPTDPSALRPGEMWEQVSRQQWVGGVGFGYTLQKIDAAIAHEGQFITRAQKLDDGTLLCTVIPVKFTRGHLGIGNMLENMSTEREQSSGTSLAFRFNLQTHAGWDAYQAFVAGQLPPVAHLSDITSPEPVSLVERESVNRFTVRHNLQLLRGLLSLDIKDGKELQRIEGTAGVQNVQSRTHEAKKRGWYGTQESSLEVHAAFDEHSEANQVKQTLRGMIIYQRFALPNGKPTTAEEREKLRNERNTALKKLGKTWGQKMHIFDTPQAPGAFGVEVYMPFTPAHVDLLSHASEEEVRNAVIGCGLGLLDGKKAAKAFGEMRAIEVQSDIDNAQPLALATNPYDPYGALVYEDPASRRARIDRDATAKQAAILRKLVDEPDMVEIMTNLLNAKLAATGQPLLMPVVDVDCPAYHAADAFLDEMQPIREALRTASDEHTLSNAFKRLAAGARKLEDALSIAECDALSPRYDADTWVQAQTKWRRALKEAFEIGRDTTLHERQDGGQVVLDSDSRLRRDYMGRLAQGLASLSIDKVKSAAQVAALFDVATRDQQVGMLCRTIASPQPGEDLQAYGKRLAEVVRDVRHDIQQLEKEIDAGEPIAVVRREKRRNLIGLLWQVKSSGAERLHVDLKKQLGKVDRDHLFEPSFYDPRPDEWSMFEVAPALPNSGALVQQFFAGGQV